MRWGITLLLCATFGLAQMGGAYANEEAGTGPNEFNATASTVDEGSTSDSAGEESTPETVSMDGVDYEVDALCEIGEGITDDFEYGCGGQETCGDDGLLYNLFAIDGDGVTPEGPTCIEPGDPQIANAAVLTPDRILEAFRRVEVPTPPLNVQPPGGRTLVNFDTILHTEAEPFQATVRLLGRDVTFDITPAEFTWDLGRGETLTTTDPGRPWADGVPMSDYVSHRYDEAGDTQVSLSTTWTARWRLNDGPWRDVDGTVTTDTAPQGLEVLTARPQLVAYE